MAIRPAKPCRLPRPAGVPHLFPLLAWAAAGLGWSACGEAFGQNTPPAPAAAAEKDASLAAKRLKLSTSDGFALAAWYYPAAAPDPEADKAASAAPVVMLLHDLGGSHASVEPLARDLQARGIAVVAPDLRGHGDTTAPASRGGIDPKSLKKTDFDGMVMTGGGRVREQAGNRGDLEAVRNWIHENAKAENLDFDRFLVVGAGVGAAVAAQWTALDAAWPDLASGPQGRQVRGLVFVSPTWTTRGFSIGPALATDRIRKELPILVLAGARDTDALKLYEQLKRQRPDGWSEKRAGQKAPTQSEKLSDGGLPSLYLRQFDTDLGGDRLAAVVPKDGRGGGHPAAIIAGFLDAVTATEP